jgi:ribosome biogenesis GTPase
VLVGSSGAGKSTLTNTLLGTEKMKTKEVRATDSRGRHTTTHRVLLPLPQGGCLIDTPGMRELKLSGDEDLAEGGFEDIEALAGACRYSDCGHSNEPGCAVNAAIAEGTLTEERYAHYCKLRDERDAAAMTLAARRAEEREAHKPYNKRLKDKYGRR